MSCENGGDLSVNIEDQEMGACVPPLAVEDKAFHGGQDWMTTENLIADFSVTTGILGPCEEALSFLDGNLHKIHHYPALDQEPYRSQLRDWLGLNVSAFIMSVLSWRHTNHIWSSFCWSYVLSACKWCYCGETVWGSKGWWLDSERWPWFVSRL